MNENFSAIFSEWEKSNSIIDKDIKKGYDSISKMKQKNEGLVIDLHGLTKKESIEKLGSFIGKNISRQPKKIIIIHGVGRHSNGKRVLKEAVKEWLALNKHLIRNFRPAGIGEGSGGATVAFIQQK